VPDASAPLKQVTGKCINAHMAGATADIIGALQTLPGTLPSMEQSGLVVRGGDVGESKAYFFGGGAKNAKPLLEKAVALYSSFTPANDLMPVWGKERCEKLLEQCQ
jgi:hypothetical protein